MLRLPGPLALEDAEAGLASSVLARDKVLDAV